MLHLALSIASILPLASAWDCDARCPLAAYVECLEQEAKKVGNRRELEPDPIQLKQPMPRDTSMPFRQANRKLRGSHRRLQSSTYFQLKLYHELGYCWQAEWEDRKWCAECTGDCVEWDYLVLQYCDQNEDKQYYGKKCRFRRRSRLLRCGLTLVCIITLSI